MAFSIYLFLWYFGPFVATIGAALGVYHEHDIGPVCWVSNYPEGCEADETVACVSPIIGWIFGGGVTILSLVVIVVNNLLIFLHVWTTTRRTDSTTLQGIVQNLQRQQEQQPQQHRQQSVDSSSAEPSRRGSTRPSRQSIRKVRAVAWQGVMYVTTGVFCCNRGVLSRRFRRRARGSLVFATGDARATFTEPEFHHHHPDFHPPETPLL
eukprot:scaffold2357_cov167-Amphora_coffeaeformis.AAC.10